MSGQTDVDHPLCEECTDTLLDHLDTQLNITENECQNYKWIDALKLVSVFSQIFSGEHYHKYRLKTCTACECLFRQCLELLSHLEVNEEETLLAELQQLKEEEERLVQELEAVEDERAAVAQDLAQSRILSQQLDTEELQWVALQWCGKVTVKYYRW